MLFLDDMFEGFVSQLYAGSESPSVNDSPIDKPVVRKEWTEAHLGQLQGIRFHFEESTPGNLVLTLLEIKKVNRHFHFNCLSPQDPLSPRKLIR